MCGLWWWLVVQYIVIQPLQGLTVVSGEHSHSKTSAIIAMYDIPTTFRPRGSSSGTWRRPSWLKMSYIAIIALVLLRECYHSLLLIWSRSHEPLRHYFTVSSPVCTLHTAITRVIQVLKPWILMSVPMTSTVACETLQFQYCIRVSDCRVQGAKGTRSPETGAYNMEKQH